MTPAGVLERRRTRRRLPRPGPDRLRKAAKIALQWIKNYLALDYRSLGSYTRADLERIAAAPDAL